MFFQKLSVSSQLQCPEEMEPNAGESEKTQEVEREGGGGIVGL